MKTLMIATGVALAAQMSIAFAEEAEAKKATPEAEAATVETKKDDTAAEDVKADVEITIEGNDTMQFDKKEFTVKEGQVVALTSKTWAQWRRLRWVTTSLF